jgi:hypothetical protein
MERLKQRLKLIWGKIMCAIGMHEWYVCHYITLNGGTDFTHRCRKCRKDYWEL